MAYIIDSGFAFAQLNKNDQWHSQVSRVALDVEREPVILPVPAISEITYLINRELGTEAVAKFVERLPASRLILETPTTTDLNRSAEVLRKYNDANIDFVDACIVAMAERLNITRILTVDRRHFSIFRPAHCQSFELLPEQL